MDDGDDGGRKKRGIRNEGKENRPLGGGCWSRGFGNNLVVKFSLKHDVLICVHKNRWELACKQQHFRIQDKTWPQQWI